MEVAAEEKAPWRRVSPGDLTPDIVLMGAVMPGLTGINTTAAIVTTHPSMKGWRFAPWSGSRPPDP